MARFPGSPDRKKMAMYGGAGVALLIVAGFLLIYFVIFPTSSPEPFKLSATTAATAPAATTTGLPPPRPRSTARHRDRAARANGPWGAGRRPATASARSWRSCPPRATRWDARPR